MGRNDMRLTENVDTTVLLNHLSNPKLKLTYTARADDFVLLPSEGILIFGDCVLFANVEVENKYRKFLDKDYAAPKKRATRKERSKVEAAASKATAVNNAQPDSDEQVLREPNAIPEIAAAQLGQDGQPLPAEGEMVPDYNNIEVSDANTALAQ